MKNYPDKHSRATKPGPDDPEPTVDATPDVNTTYGEYGAVPGANLPARTPTQRSATTSAVTDRPPEEAARLAGEQTPPTSGRIMGLPDSPKAGETGQGH